MMKETFQQEKENEMKTLKVKFADEREVELININAETKAKDQEIRHQREAFLETLKEKDDKIKTLEAEIRVLKKQMRSKGTEISELQEINSVKKEKQDKVEKEIKRYMTSQQELQSQLQQLFYGRVNGVSVFLFCSQLFKNFTAFSLRSIQTYCSIQE